MPSVADPPCDAEVTKALLMERFLSRLSVGDIA
jgi:hypothetical protein